MARNLGLNASRLLLSVLFCALIFTCANASKFTIVSENVKFFSTAASGTLLMGATITYPKHASPQQPVAGVVLIPGSGGENRNETVAMQMLNMLAQPQIYHPCGSKLLTFAPLLDIANYLTGELGVAVLRFDKRTCPVSNGCAYHANLNMSLYTDFDEVADTRHALQYLASKQYVDNSKLALIGHSEGSSIAPLVVQGLPDTSSSATVVSKADVKAVILLMGTGVGFDIVLPFQDQMNVDLITELRGFCKEAGASPAVIQGLDAGIARYKSAKERILWLFQQINNGADIPLDGIFCLQLNPAEGCGTVESYIEVAKLGNTEVQKVALNSFDAAVLAINSPSDGLISEPLYAPLHKILRERAATSVVYIPPRNLTHFMSPIDHSSASVSPFVLSEVASFIASFVLGQ